MVASSGANALALEVPLVFRAVGEWYRDFTQTTDDDVEEILSEFS